MLRADAGGQRRADAADPALDAVLLHCLNHCTKVADRIKRGNEAVRGGLEGTEAPRDQGFTRPKVRLCPPSRGNWAGCDFRFPKIRGRTPH